MKLHQSSLLKGGLVECMVSYTAIEAGNTRAKAAEAAAVTVQVRVVAQMWGTWSTGFCRWEGVGLGQQGVRLAAAAGERGAQAAGGSGWQHFVDWKGQG